MAKTYEINLDTFSGGMSDDPRLQDPNQADLISQFDIFAKPKRLTPVRSLVADTHDGSTSTGMKQYHVQTFGIINGVNSVYGLGTKSDGTGYKLFKKTTATSTSWAAVGAEGSDTMLPGVLQASVGTEQFLYFFASDKMRALAYNGGTEFVSTAKDFSDTTTSVTEGVIAKDGFAYIGRNNGIYRLAAPGTSATMTVTIASPGVFTSTAHGLAVGSRVRFTTTGALPTGIVAGTEYYVIAAGITADAFQVSATSGGSAINTSGSQSGVHTLIKPPGASLQLSVPATHEVSSIDAFGSNMVVGAAPKISGVTLNTLSPATTADSSAVGTLTWSGPSNVTASDDSYSTVTASGIAFDATSKGTGSGNTTLTFSHTCTGSNRILFVAVYDQSIGDNVSGVTYNAVAMTKVDSQVITNDAGTYESLWYLIAPATGAHNVVITRSSASNALLGQSASYTGAKQSAQPDSFGKRQETTTMTTFSPSTTVVGSGTWLVGAMRNACGSMTAGSGTIVRQAGISATIVDSNGVVPTGVQSLNVLGSCDAWGGVVASIAPVAAGATHYLKATNYSFAVPVGATINGIKVDIEEKSDSGATVTDSAVKIVKADGSIGTTNKALATPWSTTESYISYGSSTDLWGETWTYTDINDADFGVVLSAILIGNGSAYVDHMRITVYYTTAPASYPNLLSYLYLWNLRDPDVLETVDMGPGKLKIIANLGGIVLGVTDEYISDFFGNDKGKIVIRAWSGGEAAILKEIPALFAGGVLEKWKAIRGGRVYFYAKIPTDIAGTTYQEGIWGFGRKDNNSPWALVLEYDTSQFGSSVQGFRFIGNFLHVAHSTDGSISRSSDTETYAYTSIYQSQIYDNNFENQLKMVELSTEPLLAGASVVVKVRHDEETAWTTVFTSDTDGSTYELRNKLASGEEFAKFHTCQFRIESTGGAVVTEMRARYWKLNDETEDE